MTWHMTWHDMTWHDTAWHDMTRYNMMWHDMMWNDKILHDVPWHIVICYDIHRRGYMRIFWPLYYHVILRFHFIKIAQSDTACQHLSSLLNKLSRIFSGSSGRRATADNMLIQCFLLNVAIMFLVNVSSVTGCMPAPPWTPLTLEVGCPR